MSERVQPPGLAEERTELAWNRTGLAMGVAALAVLRKVWEQLDTVGGRVIVLGLVAAWGATFVGALWWAHTVGQATAGRTTAHPAVVRKVTVATLLLAVAGLVLAALPTD